MDKVEPGKYRHYKGGEYEVLLTARHSETLEEMIVYKSLYDQKKFPAGSFWVRPKKMFLKKVVVNGVEIPRFEFVA